MRARNGADFERLWNGDTSGYPSRTPKPTLRSARTWRSGPGTTPPESTRCSAPAVSTAQVGAGRLPRIDHREEPLRGGLQPSARNVVPTSRNRLGASESVESVDSARGDVGAYGLTDSALEESVGSESVPPVGSEGAGTDSDPESVRPFALPLRDFIARPREHREPILADIDGRAVIGHRSLILCGGLGGSGKTTLFVDLALHLAAGVDYPPFTVPAPDLGPADRERGAGGSVRGQARGSARDVRARAPRSAGRVRVRLGRLQPGRGRAPGAARARDRRERLRPRVRRPARFARHRRGGFAAGHPRLPGADESHRAKQVRAPGG